MKEEMKKIHQTQKNKQLEEMNKSLLKSQERPLEEKKN